jgi:hypothetical protein
MAGPIILPTCMDTVSSETAFVTRSGGTTLASSVRRAGKSSAQAMPSTTSTVTRPAYPTLRVPKSAASATAAPSDITCATTRSRQRDSRSASTPPNGPSARRGTERQKAATPTISGEPVSSRASQPRARRSTQRAVLRKSPASQR